jgi:hypothetical protein
MPFHVAVIVKCQTIAELIRMHDPRQSGELHRVCMCSY